VPAPSPFTEPLTQVDRTYVLHRGTKLSYFGGCDYLRLSSHPKVLKAVKRGLEKYGLSTSASRATTGNHPLYEEVESALASHFGFEKALLLPTGYQTNLAVAQALAAAGRKLTIFLDENAHASLVDASLSMGAQIVSFPHQDAAHLRKKLHGSKSPFGILTDGVFALSGGVAPLRDYAELLGQKGMLWVDDSHGAGLYESGQGSVGLFNLDRRKVIQTVTFSKAFGVYGGAVLCNDEIYSHFSKSRLVAGSTPLPLPLTAGILERMEIAPAQHHTLSEPPRDLPTARLSHLRLRLAPSGRSRAKTHINRRKYLPLPNPLRTKACLPIRA
jgi:8-amino-7-oxononanoate synthase